jgi:phage gp29-like protein
MALPPIDDLMNMTDAELDALMQSELTQLLESVSPERRKRLEALQWRIDIKKNNAPNKFAAMIEIHKMMMASVTELDDLLHGRQAVQKECEVYTLKA